MLQDYAQIEDEGQAINTLIKQVESTPKGALFFTKQCKLYANDKIKSSRFCMQLLDNQRAENGTRTRDPRLGKHKPLLFISLLFFVNLYHNAL
jgi:hypothetical protein